MNVNHSILNFIKLCLPYGLVKKSINEIKSYDNIYLDAALPAFFIGSFYPIGKKLIYANDSLAKMFGTSRDYLLENALLTDKFWENPLDRERFLKELKEKKFIDGLRILFTRMNGEKFWGRLSARCLKEDGQVKIHGTLIDITSSVKLEQKLKGESKKLNQEIQQRVQEIEEIQRVTIFGLSKITEYRDNETGDHILRMALYSKLIAEELGRMEKYKNYITSTYAEEIYISAPLHDIGKVGIEDHILKKPGKLTDSEFEIMKFHTVYGGDTLSEVESQLSFQSFLTLGKEIAYHHHQRWDGTGYPLFKEDGAPSAIGEEGSPLKGEEIPLSARIVSLADVYDALTSVRCYKPAFPHETAKKIILEGSGTQFDPDIVQAFLDREVDFITIKDRYQ